MLLCVVAELQAVAGEHFTGVGSFDAGQRAQQRRLARAVQTEDHDAAALVDGKVDIGEDLERPVRLRQAGR